MSQAAVLMTDMSILVGIFALGLLAKLFPKRKEQGAENTQQKAGTRS